jgi:hypothetical protein
MGSLPSSLASVFQEQRDDQGNRIMARSMIGWLEASPSSSAPSARRYAALGFDRSLQTKQTG